jgi:deoxyribodipyrimidine photolyase-related protein
MSLRLILGDQLSLSLLKGIDKTRDTLLLCEVREEATYVKHHKKKIAFIFAAMRHFADELRELGYKVLYITLDDAQNTHSLVGEAMRTGLSPIYLVEPGEFRLKQAFMKAGFTLLPDNRFLSTHDEFTAWSKGKKQLRMEYFYRILRVKHNLLIEPDQTPTGGLWNYDKENRKPAPKGLKSPKRLSHVKSDILKDVLNFVETTFSDNFGTLTPFHMAVTRAQALLELEHFITHLLPFFGDYQDAMVKGEPYLYHSLLAAYLNIGLLEPLEICQKAEAAFRHGHARLNAVEGFIRQILGWREFVRGLYWQFMPDYGAMNEFNATRPLPWFYWSGETDMGCMKEAIEHTRDHAYSHHIQRLMVTGNFALLAGISPIELGEWYLAVYADAFEWVEMPNTYGMALYADGGIMASKPYAASGNYINKMSNFCKSCTYDVSLSIGEKACPFNALYWDFMARNEKTLRQNQRMSFVYPTWDKMGEEKQKALRKQAAKTLARVYNA